MAQRIFDPARVRPAGNPHETRAELLERIRELEAENADLRSSTGAAVSRPSNPQGQDARGDLLARIRELQKENDDLQDALDRIASVAEAPDDEQSLTDDDLKEKLNKIIDLASDSDDEDDSQGEV